MKKFFYEYWWLLVLIILGILAAIGGIIMNYNGIPEWIRNCQCCRIFDKFIFNKVATICVMIC